MTLVACSPGVEPPMPEPATEADRLAESVCGWIAACECEALADEQVCRDRVAGLFALEHASARDAALRYDESCLEARIDTWDQQACRPQHEIEQDACADACQVFHGEVPIGGECTWFGNFHDCRQGLACARRHDSRDRCVDACGLREGEACSIVESVQCNWEHLICANMDAEGLGACIELPKVGEPCPDDLCSIGAFCDLDAAEGPVCRARAKLGEPCRANGECESATSCDVTAADPTCRGPASLGEPCESRVCEGDTYCESTRWVCETRKDDGQVCADDWVCRSRRCVDGRCGAVLPLVCDFAQGVPPRL